MNKEELKGWSIPVLDHGYVRLVDWYGTDIRIVETARISYKSPSKGEEQDKKLLRYLYKNRHTSPFEQCSITFNIKLPLFVQGQMVRHRTQKLNQMSARYSIMEDEFYIPTEWRKQDIKNKQGSVEEKEFNPPIKLMDSPNEYGLRDMYVVNTATEAVKEFCVRSYDLYQQLISQGISREMARIILPQNLYTEIYTTWDLHNLIHFFTLRLDEHAQYETRQYATAMYEIFEKLYPWTAEAYKQYKIKVVDLTNNLT